MRASRQGLPGDLRAVAEGRSRNADLSRAARAFGWFFRDRRTGAVVVGQWPNAPLAIFAACAGLDWLLAPTGGFGAAIRLVGTFALAYWAVDEILRGVNPWRRCLGATVFAGLVWKLGAALV